jgi:uncharacterized protein YfaA (DUF2138 family)
MRQNAGLCHLTATIMPTAKRLLLFVLPLLVAVIALSAYALLRGLHPDPFKGTVRAQALDLAHPDALIRSYSLSRLPPDLLKVPLARDVLTEDFVDYYEHHENRLALSGTVRRIAFEHKLDFPEKLIESVFDEPAELALWRDASGRLKYFAIALTRNALARAIQLALPTLTDAQLSSAGRLAGTEVELLVLEYGHQRLLLANRGNRVVALSDPGMLIATTVDENGEAASPEQSADAVKVIIELLDGENGVSPFARHFQLTQPLPGKTHQLLIGASVFAFGYEAFTPALAALDFTFDDTGKWQSAALVDKARFAHSSALWSTLPHGPSLCAALPVDWTLFSPLLSKLDMQSEVADAFTARLDGSAAVCWYPNARLYMPLFAARLKAPADEAQAREFFALAEKTIRAEGESTPFDPQTASGQWRGEQESPYGSGNGERSLKPALAVARDMVLFSPETALVSRALEVGAKRYPAVADNFTATGSADADVLAIIDPAALAGLLQQETFAALPRREEELFRNAAETYLGPRFDVLARYPAQRISISVAHSGSWHMLNWDTLQR